MQRQKEAKLKEYKKIISQLKKENKRLRREATHRSPSQAFRKSESFSDKFSSECREASLARETSYASYLKSKLLSASLYNVWTRYLAYFRRIRLVSTIIKAIAWGLTIIGTGAFFLVATAGLILLIPIIILIFALFLAVGTLHRKKCLLKLRKSIEANSVFVFFPVSGAQLQSGSFFESTAKIISKDTNNKNFVIIVSPFLISPRGLKKDGAHYYHIMRTESEKIWIVRKHAYFYLKNRLLSELSASVTYVY